jgi:hypothetical protein
MYKYKKTGISPAMDKHMKIWLFIREYLDIHPKIGLLSTESINREYYLGLTG